MRIYTKTGDTGGTALYGGTRVSKDTPRVEAYGTIDELNAGLGLAHAALSPGSSELGPLLLALQAALFDLGAELATAPERSTGKAAARLTLISAEDVTALEQHIDRYEAELEPLRTFILPGGCSAAAALHMARTVARRAERRIVSLAAAEQVNPEILRYVNRLSDLLFVLARTANRLEGVSDIPWHARTQPAPATEQS